MSCSPAPDSHPRAIATDDGQAARDRGAASELARDPEPIHCERELALHELREAFFEERTRIIGAEQRRTADAFIDAPSAADPSSARHEQSPVDPFLERERLDAIEAALEAFAQGTYGDCSHCGVPIELERLRSCPNIEWCESCENENR